MSSPSKVCTNCAPIIFEYYQKGLAVQTELMRTRDELQRLNFTRQMGTLKDLSDADISVSPQGKYQSNSRISGKRPFNLNLTQKETSRLFDRQASLATTATIIRSSTPGKFSEKIRQYNDNQKRAKDVFASVNTILQPSMESVSPLDRIKNFEDQVNKKVDTFKKKLREEVARSAIRPSYTREAPSRPKTSIKASRFLEDDENKSAPKVSMFSPNNVKKNLRTSPIQFRLTPRQDGKENIEKGSAISRAEWTVGTNREHRGTTNTDRERTLLHTYEKNQKRDLNSSIKKIKTNFAKELNMMRVETSPGPQDKKHNSPYFSPLKASDLMSPNGHIHIHGKSEDLKHNYTSFIKPSSNPLLDSLMFSPRDQNPKSTPSSQSHHEEAQILTDRSSRKGSVFMSKQYDSMLKRSSENSPPKNYIKRDKDFFGDSKKDSIFQDGLYTSLGATKFNHSQSFSKVGNNKLFQK